MESTTAWLRLIQSTPWKKIQKLSLVFDKEKLYKNMVDAKADWLYELTTVERDF